VPPCPPARLPARLPCFEPRAATPTHSHPPNSPTLAQPRPLHPLSACQEYAVRVNTLRAYDAVSRDVMARWAYPLVPDTNVFGGGRGEGAATAYRYDHRNRIYL